MTTLPEKWVGKELRRREDGELLAGRGRFIGDVARPGMLRAVFLRSPHPHARLGTIDTERARAVPGVHAVLTASDLPADLGAQPCTHPYAGQRETPYYALARDKVRYVGEPVAIVVAESQYVAEDAREEIEVDWDPLPSVGNCEAALATDAPRLYEDWPDNVAGVYANEMGDVDHAFAEADIVVSARVHIPRVFGCPIEPRGFSPNGTRSATS